MTRTIEDLIETHMGLARSIAKSFRHKTPRGMELDDLVSIAMLGLVQAAERFDAGQGTPFCAYARLRIRGAIVDALRSHDVATRGERTRYKRNHGHAPAVTADCNPSARRGRCSSQRFAAGSVSIPKVDLVADFDDIGDAGNPRQESLEVAELLRKRAHSLSHKERMTLYLRYQVDMSYKQIASRLGISSARVCQLHKRAIEKLRP